MSHVAVIDIGKTNAKLALVDRQSLTEIAVVTRPNTVIDAPPWPHFDIEGHWTFLLEALAGFHADHGIAEISITTHGASITLIDANGDLAAPMLDYEHKGPDDLAAEYDAIRPPFSETGSARLSMGLNVGAQLYWQFKTDPSLAARTARVLTYPQFWAFRLTGIAATEVTSLGCHTDLWNPHAKTPSSLAAKLGIDQKLAPVRPADEALGPIHPTIARQTGLDPATPVRCGIHDSNASLLPHLLCRKAPFSVVSSGTWVIAMAVGGKPVTLDPARDTLINVNAMGDPVPSARFMGGREHDLATGGTCPDPTDADIQTVLAERAMLLPAIVPETGPFQGKQSTWIKEPTANTGRRNAAVSFYLALVTAHCLELVGHQGPIIVEGPFAKNRCYRLMLAEATGSEVQATASTTGTSQGAALLGAKTAQARTETATTQPAPPDLAEKLTAYADQWRAQAEQ